MTITTRAGKGSELTHTELDTNFTDLRDGKALQVPKGSSYGIKVDSEGTPDFGWRDLTGIMQTYGGAGEASRNVFVGGIKALQFTENDSAYVDFHFPHDYAMGTHLYVHVHWSHTSALVTGGTVTWGIEFTYAKGHNQGAYPATNASLALVGDDSTTPRQHIITEVLASSVGGSSSTIDVAILEPDAVGMARVYLDSNDITVSGGGIPEPYIHFVDLHYQSTGVGTKNKDPDFWT